MVVHPNNSIMTGKPWERQPTDTEKSFEAFMVYMHMEGRTLAKAAEQLGKSTQQLNTWSHRHNWHSRVVAYDNHKLELEATYQEREMLGQAKLRVRVAGRALKIIDRELKKLEADPDESLGVKNITALMKVASDLSRIEAGLPTENINLKKSVENLTEEELDTLIAKRLANERVDREAEESEGP